MSVNISHNGALRQYSVTNAMLVQNLIDEICEKQQLSRIILKLGAITLIKTNLVKKYLLTQLTLCTGGLEVAVEINDITLDVRMVSPQSTRVLEDTAAPGMTVGQLKQKISPKFISTDGNWVLKANGRALPDSDLLGVHLARKTFTTHQEFQIIASDGNAPHAVYAHADMTIAELRAACAKKFNGYSEIRLSVRSIYLEDRGEDGLENRVGSCGIQKNDTITVVAALQGGHVAV